VPEAVGKGEKSLQRLFLETQVLFIIAFALLGVALFSVAIFYPNTFLSITKSNPIIHFLEYHLPLMENGEFSKGYPPEKLLSIKKEVYEEILAKHGEIDCETAQKVFEKHGVSCQIENLTSKKVNVYELIKKIADKSIIRCPR
jgi:heat shock protein HtpX